MSKTKQANALILLTVVIAIAYLCLHLTGLSQQTVGFIGIGWNAILAGLAAFTLLRKDFLEQFKHFNFKIFLAGLPLTLIVGFGFSSLYVSLFGQITQNSIESNFQPLILLTQVPLMILGEEIISTNLLIALQKRGLNFAVASVIVSILFAFWHVTAYGFHPLQLLFTLGPVRLLLNYLWHRSESLWVSWGCHYLYDVIALLLPFIVRGS